MTNERSSNAMAAEHLANLMDQARDSGDIELYCELQGQLARIVERTIRAARNAKR